MLVKTRFFGEVDLPEEKILTFYGQKCDRILCRFSLLNTA